MLELSRQALLPIFGLPDSNFNRANAAEPLARRIEGDIATGNFDPTLKKYKPESQQKYALVGIPKLFELFMAEKAKEVTPKTMEKYKATLDYLSRYFGNEAAKFVDNASAENFAQHLTDKGLSPIQRKRRLEELQACWKWANDKRLIDSCNPWKDVAKRIKVPPKQMPKPFTREEIEAIIHAFRTDRYYHPYADLVEFLFATGCRTGEAIGLRWGHLSENCSTAWIGECLTRGVRRPAKTNRARIITLTPKLQVMLLARRPTDFDPDGLVFISVRGGAIDDHNFTRRIWKTVLTRLEIDYRRFYLTRHSMISHALDLG